MSLNAYANAVKNEFTDPVSSDRAKNEWRLEADQVAQFIDEKCEEGKSGDTVKISNLFADYKN